MARPRLPVGSHGTIRTKKQPSGKWIAETRVRDADGRVRDVRVTAASKQAATTRLQEAIAHRPGFSGTDLTGDTRLADVADRWMADIDAQVAANERSPSTARVYRGILNRHLRGALGELAIREVTVPRAAAFLRAMRSEHGGALTKTTRTVLSGVLGYAVQQGVIPANPVREVGRIRGDRRKPPSSLTDVQREQLLGALEADEIACRHDLPDLARFLLATGCRIGEALAVTWADVDLDNKEVAIDWTVTRLEKHLGGGLTRTPTKSAAGQRTLPLPGWAVDMLRARRDAGTGEGPVFPNQTKARGLRDPSNTSRAFREARGRGIGLPTFTSHMLRRTVATTLHDSGLVPRQVADQLGHASIRILDSYIGRRAVSRDAAVALEVAFGENPE